MNRKEDEFVLHTTKKIRQAIKSFELDDVKQIVCNADTGSHKTVKDYLLNKVPLIFWKKGIMRPKTYICKF